MVGKIARLPRFFMKNPDPKTGVLFPLTVLPPSTKKRLLEARYFNMFYPI